MITGNGAPINVATGGYGIPALKLRHPLSLPTLVLHSEQGLSRRFESHLPLVARVIEAKTERCA